MFPDGVIPDPKKPIQLGSMSLDQHCLELPFVNQENQLLFAWRTLISNQTGNTHNKALVASQMNGSGKTIFGQNLLNWSNPKILQLFETGLNDCDQSHKDNLKNALPVYIDLQTVRRKDANESLDTYISWLIFSHTFQQYFDLKPEAIAEYWSGSAKAVRSPYSCTQILQELLGRRIFVHIDEMGQLPLKLNSQSGGDVVNLTTMFLSAVHPVQLAGSFLFLSGESRPLLQAGQGSVGSTCKVAQLRLSLFKEEDIRDLLWNSNSQTPSQIGDALMLRDVDSVLAVSQWLSQLTSGVPHYVTSLLTYMATETTNCGNSVDWGTYPEDKLLDILSALGRIPNPRNDRELIPFLWKALHGIAFMRYETLASGLSISELASHYGLPISLHKCGFTVTLPDLWSKRIDVPLKLWNYLQAQDPSLLHKGRALEIAVLYNVLEKTMSFGIDSISLAQLFDFLSESHVGAHEISSTRLGVMEKRVTAKNQESVWREFDVLADGCVHVPAASKSKMPDLVTLLPRQSAETSRSMIGWEMKNRPKSNWSMRALQEAADNFGKLLRNCGDAGGVLVVVLTGNGTGDVESLRGRLITSENVVPGLVLTNDKMQVIVLSEADVDRLIGGSSVRFQLLELVE
jgi:hypothetical protein